MNPLTSPSPIARIRAGLLSGALACGALTGCASDAASGWPQISAAGTKPHEYTATSQLAEQASAVVIAHPTGEQFDRPLPAGYSDAQDPAPTPYVKMRVEKVLSGAVEADVIDVVSPGEDAGGSRGLASGAPYLLFLTPAMYAADDPAGGHAVVGGSAGAYAKADGAFHRTDDTSRRLPDVIDPAKAPRASHSATELLRRGPA